MESTNDINIGENKWIKWIDFDEDADFLEIDPLLDPTWQFWKSLETNCMADCCGIDAFSFWPKDLKAKAEHFNIAGLITDLDALKVQIQIANQSVLVSDRLNNAFESGVFIELIDHIVTTLKDK